MTIPRTVTFAARYVSERLAPTQSKQRRDIQAMQPDTKDVFLAAPHNAPLIDAQHAALPR